MTEAIFKSRRDFLAGTALALTSAAVPLPVLAANTRKLAGRPALVLYQAHDAHATAFADELAAAGFSTLVLTDDPVRQWRDGLGRLVLAENFVLLGLSNWADYFVVRGLAAEHRRFPLLERPQRRQSGTAWARQQARALLARADADDLPLALRELQPQGEHGARPDAFFWVI
jgi:hypothetical protein